MKTKWLNLFALAIALLAVLLVGYKNYHRESRLTILNVSYDPTRELYDDINKKFVLKFEEDAGSRIAVEQSHGGSSRQARAVANGLAADVVTLALPSDIDILVKHRLVAEDWQNRFPNHAQPYSSTIVFVVRRGNPKHISDWQDLIKADIGVVTPNPVTSGNGKLSFLAAWGAVIYRGGNEEQARDFVRRLYGQVSALGQGARDAATTFALEGVGDVHLTWENEALREAKAANGDLEVVYPSVSILATPSVALIDSTTELHHSTAAATAYLNFLFTDAGQESTAAHGYRPFNKRILTEHHATFPNIALFPITLIAKDWGDADQKFFGDNGVYSLIRQSSPQPPAHPDQ